MSKSRPATPSEQVDAKAMTADGGDSATPAAVPAPRSRRALIQAGIAGMAGLALGTSGTPEAADAAAGGNMLLGRANNATTAGTSLTTKATAVALTVTQTGTGGGIKASAVGGTALQATSTSGTGISGSTASNAKQGVTGVNSAATAGTGAAVYGDGRVNVGVRATATSGTALVAAATTGPGAQITTGTAGKVALEVRNDGAAWGPAAGVAVRAIGGTAALSDITGVHDWGVYPAAGEFAGASGVIGVANTDGAGVVGRSSSGAGLIGRSASGPGLQVLGGAATTPAATVTNDNGSGSTAGVGIRALAAGATDATITNTGYWPAAGEFASTAIGIVATGGNLGIAAHSDAGTALRATSTSSPSIVSDSSAGNGVEAYTSSKTKLAVLALNQDPGTTSNAGVALRALTAGATAPDLDAVHSTYYPAAGEFAGPTGVIGLGQGSGAGVIGISTDGVGVRGKSTSSYGVVGSGTTGGVSGETTGGTGVAGNSQSGAGVAGNSQSGNGVAGQSGGSSLYAGVLGTNTGTGYGVISNGKAKVFGNLEVTGTLSKAGGTFRIDHPLDPAHRFLSHSFVESPDMKNVYDGVVELDANGEATVTLPDWFEALNRDFRYQLTAVGAAAPALHVRSRIKDNAFTIAGGEAGLEVSWQVTGIRRDAWAEANRTPVEEDKTGEEAGRYLHPEAHGQDASKGINHALVTARAQAAANAKARASAAGPKPKG